MSRRRLGSVLFVLSLLVAACAGDRVSSSTPTLSVYFIQPSASGDDIGEWTPGEVRKEIFLTAEITGKLVLVDACLRLDVTDSETSYLLVWPRGFSLRAEDGQLQILDGSGQIVGRVGEEIFVSGGEVQSVDQLNESVRQVLSSGCPGPFWLVGLHARLNG